MQRKILLIFLLLVFSANVAAQQGDKTVIKDQSAKIQLLGEHRFSLQWISWDYFGKANVREDDGMLLLKGEQKARKGSDYLSIEGVITSVDTKEFKFKGTIITQISHINNGNPCKREGEMTFKITGTRKYWRLKEMDNPCEGVTDYVDIYFRK